MDRERTTNMKINSCSLLALAVFLKLSTCPGADLGLPANPHNDPDLPQPFDIAAAEEILANSPFTRPLNLAHSLQLTGIAYVGGHPVATFFNKETKGSFVLSEEPNALGWRLAETNPRGAIQRTQVKILVMGELVTVAFGDEQINPGPSRRGMAMARSERTHPSGGNSPADSGRTSDKLREKIMESLAKKHPEYSQQQLEAIAQKFASKIPATDQRDPGNGSTRSSKSSKSR